MNFEQSLDPELRAVLAMMPGMTSMTVDVPVQRKAMLEMMAALPQVRSESVTIEDRHIPGPEGAPKVFVRIYVFGDGSLAAWKLYLANEASSDISPYAAPSRAKDLSGLPPAYICIGECDLMRDENIEYAMRLMQAGVSTELHIYPGAFHGFDVLVPTAAVSQRAVSEYVDALKRALNR